MRVQRIMVEPTSLGRAFSLFNLFTEHIGQFRSSLCLDNPNQALDEVRNYNYVTLSKISCGGNKTIGQ